MCNLYVYIYMNYTATFNSMKSFSYRKDHRNEPIYSDTIVHLIENYVVKIVHLIELYPTNVRSNIDIRSSVL